jgi:hypothetical protein
MRQITVVVAVTLAWLTGFQTCALADVQGNGDGGSLNCLGLGYLGPSVGVAGACDNGVPVPTKQPPAGHTSGQPEQDKGDYWAPLGANVAKGDYAQCANGVVPVYWQEYDARGQPIGQPEAVCPTPQAETTTSAVPPPPPPEEVWANTPLPDVLLRFNPATVGLTQLATFFWVSGVEQNVQVGIGIEGYRLTVSASPKEFLWNFGDGGSARSTVGGSPGNPAVEHTYAEAGSYRVTLTIIYAGNLAYSGPAGQGTEALPSYWAGPYSATYTVQQVRSVLVAPAGM